MNDTQYPKDDSPATVPWDLDGFNSWVSVGRVTQLAKRAMAAALAEVDLELHHYDILSTVYRYPGITQGELGERLLVGRSNLSMLLPELERRQWLLREVDNSDKRVRRMTLTSEGNKHTEEGLKIQTQVIKDMLSVISTGECTQVEESMRKVITHLQK